MEVLLELLLPVVEFLAEIVVQVAFEALVELGFHAAREPFRRSKAVNAGVATIGYAIFGAIAGGVSLWIFPASFITSHSARVANLVVTPVVAGAVMSAFGAWRRRRGEELLRLDRFAYAMVFAFAMAVVRFVFSR
jgi:hypothetical protein